MALKAVARGEVCRSNCLNLDGTVSKQAVTINLAKGVSDQSNPILRENDIIVVSRSGTTQIVDTLGL